MAEFVTCSAGKYCLALSTSTDNEGYCGAGYYCPQGTPFKIPCDMGHYCDLHTMSAIDTAKVCDAGYVCLVGAYSATPTDGTTGYQCPAGHFCLAGSTRETPCLIGSYRGSVGATADTDCTTCTGGEQCNARGLSAPTGNDIICSAGYYCPDSLTTIVCERGYYCP